MGLGMGLVGEYELTQIQSAVDCLTITGVSTSGAGILLTTQNSDKTPAVNGFRVYDYGRTRIIRTDDATHGSAYKNALDVKYDLNYDYTGDGAQVYCATFIHDLRGGGWGGGRSAVIQLQHFGTTASANGNINSWFMLSDGPATETCEMGCFVHFASQTIASGNMMEGLNAPAVTHGLVIYWNATKYWLMVTDTSGTG